MTRSWFWKRRSGSRQYRSTCRTSNWGITGERCSFDAIIEKYHIDDPALLRLAEIVRGADTSNRNITPESAGLYALATGFHALSPSRFVDDHALLEVEFPVYDALYEFCRRS